MKPATTHHEKVMRLAEDFKTDEKKAILGVMKMLNATYSDLLYAQDALSVFVIDEKSIGTLYQTVYDLQGHTQELKDAAVEIKAQLAPVYQEYLDKKIDIVEQKIDFVLDTIDMKFIEFT